MPIDESIKVIEIIKKRYITLYKEELQALTDALNIMRKYQQIKAIYDKWNADFGVETHRAMSKIGEILEDGDDN